jgi:GH15 family glucan-1,4-alpha-glucosidase
MRDTRRNRAAVMLALAVGASWTCSGERHPALAPQMEASVTGAATQPTNVSAASLYLSNWTNAQNIWMASKLAETDVGNYGPRIAEMRISADWTTNQIIDYSDFFRDETHAAKYDQPHRFDSQAYLDETGILRTTYLAYAGNDMPIAISKAFATVPNRDFTIATLTFTNGSPSAIVYGLLDQLHVDNKTRGGANANIHGWFDRARNALFVDMSGSGQYFVALASLQSTIGHQVARDSNADTSSNDVAAWFTFDADGTVKNNDDVIAADISVAFQDQISIPAGRSATRAFVITVQPTLAAVEAAIDTARGDTADHWFSETQNAYRAWLTGPGKQTVAFSDTGLDAMYARNLIVIKNAINPSSGALPAATNPFGYAYKVWARDSAVTAIALDLAGFTSEAAAYWSWLVARQQSDGTFKTTFNLWDSGYLPFVEPESDSIGIFLIGAWTHYRVTGDKVFLDGIWPAYQRSADYLWRNIGSDPYAFGVPDFSIWEETFEYNVFSQVVFAAGEDAAQSAADAMGRPDLADNYNGVASKIRSSIQRDDTWFPAGLWNVGNGYYDRAVNTNGTARTTIDGASDALIVFGVVDAASSRARSHTSRVIAADGHDGFGISRYAGDTYYSTSPFDPAGNETQSDAPTWPQLSAYLAIDAAYRHDDQAALQYLQWMASRSFVGYMAAGEAVSRTLLVPVVSTGVEPVTGAWFIMAALAASGRADLRVASPQSNAGAFRSISVTGNVANDLAQWSEVPYFVDPVGDNVSGFGDTDISRVHLANDADNLYVRVRNVSEHLSSGFAIHLYAEDFAHGGDASTPSDFYAGTLSRPMQSMVGRWSDGNNFARFAVQNGGWTWTNDLDGVLAPQWDPNSGNIEMVVPLSALSSSGHANPGDWANLIVVLSRQDPSTCAWREDDQLAVHYRITQAGDAWYYGNVE